MLSVLEELKQSRYAGANRYLGGADFGVMLMAAAAVHLFAVVLWNILPDKTPEAIPVRVLNVRLGSDTGTLLEAAAMGGDAPVGGAAPAPKAEPEAAAASSSGTIPTSAEVRALDAMLSQLQNEDAAKPGRDKKKRVKAAIAVGHDDSAPSDSIDVRGPARYVRQKGQWGDGTGEPATGKAAGGSVAGSPLGNSTDPRADLLSRYSQVIALWFERNKYYPVAAAQKGLQGEAKVRITVDRRGTIPQYRIVQSSGHAVIDDAVREIVRRSNPVPVPPADYPDNKLDFIVVLDFNSSDSTR